MAEDPRITEGLDATVNGRLLNRSILHAIRLSRLQKSEQRKIVGFLQRNVLPDLYGRAVTRLERIRAKGIATDFTQERFKRMILSLGGILDAGFLEAKDKFQGDMDKLAVTEAQWQVAGMTSAFGAAAPLIDVTLPTAGFLRTIVRSRPIVRGAKIPDAFKRLSSASKKAMEDTIKAGMIEGQTSGQIVRALRNGVGDAISKRALGGLVRTATNAVATQSRQSTYEANSDILNGWQYVATLDGRTTLICIGLDGKVFEVGSGPYPPQHFGCRSADVPVTKSWRQLGLPFGEIGPGTRASMNGQVPGSITYSKWIKQQPRAFQREVLGRGRLEIFDRGELPLDRFTDSANRVLTLGELRAKEADIMGA